MGKIVDGFSRWEFECRCGKCNCSTVDYELLNILIDLRNHFGNTVNINSAHRCKKHNKNVGGRSKSWHLQGMAVDVWVSNTAAEMVYAYLINKYPEKYGIILYKKNRFVHIDVRPEGKHHAER